MMLASCWAALLAAAVSVSAVIVPYGLPVSAGSSSSAASASSQPPRACKPRTRNTALFDCFTSSSPLALMYCATDAGVTLPSATTTITVQPTVYVASIQSVTDYLSTDVELSTAGFLYTSTSTTTTTTFTSTTTSTFYVQPLPIKRQAAAAAVAAPRNPVIEVRADHIEVVTVRAILRRTYTVVPPSCVTAAPTSTTIMTLRVKKRDVVDKRRPASSVGASSASQALPTLACLDAINPAPASLTSVCSAFVSAYGTPPGTSTDLVELPAVTLLSGVSTVESTVSSTLTRTRLTIVETYSVTTATVTTCEVVTKTVLEVVTTV